MTQPIHYAFIDESGTSSPFAGSRFLLVSALVTTNPRPIELHVKRARKKLRRNPSSGELKGSLSDKSVISRFLRAIADERVDIITVVVDKQHIVRPASNGEMLYYRAVTEVVRHVVSLYPNIDICLDKRYTTKRQTYELERVIREGMAMLKQEVVIICQEDSVAHKRLQAVDMAAWSIFQKYEHNDEQFYQLIAKRISYEEVIQQNLW